MKIASRQSTLLIIVILVLVLLAYVVFIQNPTTELLKNQNIELSRVEAEKKQIDQTILAGQGLNAEIEAYKLQISGIEQRLLPVIETQVIAQKIQDKFIQHGIPFITLISTETPVEDRVLEPDGVTVSDNLLRSVRFNFQVCGTDGRNMSILDIGTEPTVIAADPAVEGSEEVIAYKIVGYDEFMNAVKDVEDDLPDSVKLKVISLEDTGEGFMYYNLTVVVYAYDLPDRISEPVMEGDYITWTGAPVNNIVKEGLVGIPYDMVPESTRDDNLYRPFAIVPVEPETTEP